MTKPNTLDLKEPQQNLRDLKRQSRKAKPILRKEIMTKLEKEDKQEKAHKKNSKILTKLLTMKLFLQKLLKQKDKKFHNG